MKTSQGGGTLGLAMGDGAGNAFRPARAARGVCLNGARGISSVDKKSSGESASGRELAAAFGDCARELLAFFRKQVALEMVDGLTFETKPVRKAGKDVHGAHQYS